MPARQDRSNAYYERVLKLKHLSIYKDYKAGRYKSLRQALLAAGIIRQRSRVQELKNAWEKATLVERSEFHRWLSSRTVTLPSVPASASAPPIAVDRRLEPWAKARIETIAAKRHLKPGDVLMELGLTKLDGSVGRALSRGARLQPAVLTALEKWISDNATV